MGHAINSSWVMSLSGIKGKIFFLTAQRYRRGVREVQASRNALITKMKAIPAFKDFSDSVLASLVDGVEFVRVEADTVLYRAGATASACYLICYGRMRLMKMSPTGKEALLCFCRPGEDVAAALMMTYIHSYPFTAVAVEDSGLLRIPRDVYVENWMSKLPIARAMGDITFRRMLDLGVDKALTTSPVPKKIASFLLRTLDKQPKEHGDTISMRLTRRDIAECLGTTVETVIRVLSAWTQNGWIETGDKRISIRNRAALEALISDEGSDFSL
jgi:CRP-like cAMP-binding protein